MIKVFNFIIENKLTLFIPVLLLMTILIIASFGKEKKVPWVSLSLTVISLLAFLASLKFKINLMGKDFIIFIAGFTIISLFFDITVYIHKEYKFKKLIKLIAYIPSNIESNIYVYLDDKSKIIMLTEQFYNIFELSKMKMKNLKQAIKDIISDEKHMNIKEFSDFLRKFEEKNFTVNFISNKNKDIKLELFKRKVTCNGKLLGYILFNQKLTPNEVYKASVIKDLKKQIGLYFNLLNDAICYYDFEKRKYILSDAFAKLVNIQENEIDDATFEHLVVNEDYKFVLKRSYNINPTKILYRLNTINSFDWFEENTINNDGNNILIIHQSNLSDLKYNFKNYQNLLNELKSMYEQKLDFSLVFISFNESLKIIEKIGLDGCEVITSKFFMKISETSPITKVFNVGMIEYCIIIDKSETYEMILRDLNNNSSIFLGTTIVFNELKFDLKNSVGLVESKNVSENNAQAILKAGFDALAYATNDKYPKRYSIYYPKKSSTINFDEFKIDLSDNFLDKILNDKKE